MLAASAVIHNANVITLDDRAPKVRAIVIYNDRIVFAGDDRAALAFAGPNTQTIDLAGKTIVPGFIDSHIHLAWFGTSLLREANLVGTTSIDEILARLADLAARTSGWIRGIGFDQSKINQRRFPTRAELDRVSRDRPIVISRVCGHAGVANSAAIGLLPSVERGAGDETSGLYTEEALWAFYKLIPPLSEEEMEQAVLKAADVLLSTGITAVQTLLDTLEQMTAYTRLHRAGRLPIRVVAIPPFSAVEQLHRHGMLTGFGDEWLRIGGCKLFGDGSLGAQTALLSSPYADKPETLGLRIYEPDELKRRAIEAQRKGFSLAIHAIGDQAVREVLEAIEYALDHDELGRDNSYHRHRIEHVSLCPPNLVERLAKRKIIATLQPQFVTSDTRTPDRIGRERVPWAYPFRTLLRASVPVSLSSDCPVEWPSAFECLASAVGRHEWSPAETLTPLEAVRAYCLGSAYAGNVEKHQGSIEAGKLADFVVLSGDPSAMNASQIRALKAEQVWIGGRRTR